MGQNPPFFLTSCPTDVKIIMSLISARQKSCIQHFRYLRKCYFFICFPSVLAIEFSA